MAVVPGTEVAPDIIKEDFEYKVTNLVKHATNSHYLRIFGIRITGQGPNPTGATGLNPIFLYNYASDLTYSDPTSPSVSSLGTMGSPLNITNVVNTLRTYMEQYARFCRVTLVNKITNGGNHPLGMADNTSMEINVRKNTAIYSVLTAVRNQFNNDVNTYGLNSPSTVSSENMNDFINACQRNWVNNCINSSKQTYNYNYCHSNHANHASHGSRGRR